MKHVPILVITIMVIVALGLVTGQEYKAYQNREHARVNAANTQVINEQIKNKVDKEALQGRIGELYAQCKIGEADYNLLPAATKSLKTTIVPACGLPIVE